MTVIVGKLASFALGLLFGLCLAVYGLRSFLFRQDNLIGRRWFDGLMRQGTAERPSQPAATLSSLDRHRAAPPPAPSSPPARSPAPEPSPLPAPPAPAPQPAVTQKVQTTTKFPASQNPSGLKSCVQRSCLGTDVSGIHRSVILLATGPQRFPVFHSPGFFPLYVVTSNNEAKILFEGGADSVWYGLDRFQDLPFTDFAADILVLDVSSFSKAALGSVITEAVCILAQQGVFFLLGAADFNLADFSPQAAKLVLTGSHAHSFVRRRGVVPDLPICQACGMTSIFGQRPIKLSPQNQCQAWVKPGFKSIFDPVVARKFNPKSKESFAKQRLEHWDRTNVLKILQNGDLWTDTYSKRTRSYVDGYVTSKPTKLPPALEAEVKAGKRKRILDAGAGTCSLEGELRRKGYLKRVDHFLAFGAYDCSMLRVCAERGSISFQHNWLVPLPVCSTCKFDLILQYGGVHHMATVDDHQKFLDNMLALLECNGLLFVHDGGNWKDAYDPILEVKRKQTVAKHRWNGKDEVWIHRTC